MDAAISSHELQDWELLNSDSDPEIDHPVATHSLHSLDQIDSAALIQLDYFSLEAQTRRSIQETDDSKSAGSDNPSWIDPGLDENPTRFLNKEPCESWSDSSSDKSLERKLEASDDVGLLKNGGSEVGFEGIGETSEDLGKFYSDSSGSADSEVVSEVNRVSEVESNEVVARGGGGGEIERRGVVWWKMPMEFLRYCVFRMSPVWSVSVAAAVMGFFILGRRLYKMKRKARGLEIKVAVDDKKVSQVMSRAARLNEAFTIVKRVPVIRPSLPALGGTTNWPAMTLR